MDAAFMGVKSANRHGSLYLFLGQWRPMAVSPHRLIHHNLEQRRDKPGKVELIISPMKQSADD